MIISFKRISVIKSIAQILILLSCCIMLIVFSKGASNGAESGLKYCGELLIPSLFPFMVLSSYIVHSGISLKLNKIFAPIMRIFFRLPGSAAPTVIMSFIGGFPVGAKGIAGMYESGLISESQAKRMSLFCVGAGPAFLITAVGTILLNNTTLGVIIFISQIISGFILGIISRFFYSDNSVDVLTMNTIKLSSGNAFIKSCSDGANGIISLSALVVIFQAFIGVLEQSKLSDLFSDFLYELGLGRFSGVILPSVLEVTGACSKIVNSGLPLWLLSSVIAFGGICVHLQIWGILSNIKIKKTLFILFRLINCILSGVITYSITCFYNPANDVFSNFSENPTPNVATHISGSIALLLISAFFVFIILRYQRTDNT